MISSFHALSTAHAVQIWGVVCLHVSTVARKLMMPNMGDGKGPLAPPGYCPRSEARERCIKITAVLFHRFYPVVATAKGLPNA